MRKTPKRREEIRKHRKESIDDIICSVGIFGMVMSVLYLFIKLPVHSAPPSVPSLGPRSTSLYIL